MLTMAEYIEHEEQFPIIKESEYYFSINTEHFYFDVYKAWNSCTNRKQEMFRASVNVKKGDRKYLIEYSLFAEWDYQDKQTAFAEAKKWVLEYAQRLCEELKLTPATDVAEVVHGEWIAERSSVEVEFRCSECTYSYIEADPNQNCDYNYCPKCGAKMEVSGNENV